MPMLPSSSPSSAPPQRWGWLGWLGIGVLALVPLGVGYWAIADLIQLPALPRCFNARNAQPAQQIYCAEQLASQHETDDLRRAMLLADSVPQSHPLRDESDRLIQVWTTEILRRADAHFQDGELQKAVDLALEVPANVPTSAMAREQVQAWEDLWSNAEDIYRQAEAHMDNQEWERVLALGRRLWQLDNRYWSTTRYQQLMRSLQTARDNAVEQRKAERERDRAPDTVDEFIAQWESQQAEADLERLNTAQQLAQSGDLDDLRQAVRTAQQVLYGTPHYERAQGAIAQWRQQIEIREDRPYLERAQQLASAGNLQAAINEASNIGWGRALYDDARGQIEAWRDRLYQQQIQQQNAELDRMTGISPTPTSPASPAPAQPTEVIPSPQVTPIPNSDVRPVSDEPAYYNTPLQAP